MNIKQHLCGLAIAYDGRKIRQTDKPNPDGRPQGSLFNQQKRKIADATAWMIQNCNPKPLIMTATTPGFLDHASESSLISKLTANLRNGYGVRHYLWVREFTQAGHPHFHFLVDTPFLDAVKLSRSWSSYFGSDAINSIRLGSKPGKDGKRVMRLQNMRMAWYFSKYFGKSLGKAEQGATNKMRSFRRFHISRELARESEPLVFEDCIEELYTGLRQRSFFLNEAQAEKFYDQERPPPTFNPYKYTWNWTGHGLTYTGIPKQWHKNKHKAK